MHIIEKILLIVISLGLVYILIKIISQKKTMQVMNKIGKEMISSGANFFGQESARFTQIRGNGVLALTKDKIYFQLLLQNKVIEMPLEKIERIEECRSHLGKTVGSINENCLQK
ncbi:hypothetical protein EDD79_102510 [Serpentinicella alkaliphila]|uniref:Uncharacterized protein n=1 Tax=Serpentinicella alkaliphila TaxID=1734049 RepID=A0A4R2U1V2_9FIRM|nr:hypothetical protein EDD79_102510 [Serpentinicella alkaliphila]